MQGLRRLLEPPPPTVRSARPPPQQNILDILQFFSTFIYEHFYFLQGLKNQKKNCPIFFVKFSYREIEIGTEHMNAQTFFTNTEYFERIVAKN